IVAPIIPIWLKKVTVVQVSDTTMLGEVKMIVTKWSGI
ncbi:MAG: hypothetical protein JWQ40_2474, partial [Segetibacter sp.]|nr:hypothetical protein [Segetibacter sp.]